MKKILDKKIRHFGQKSKNSTKILVIFNDFSWLHQLCDLVKNNFFGDFEQYRNNLDQKYFGKLKKKTKHIKGFLKLAIFW